MRSKIISYLEEHSIDCGNEGEHCSSRQQQQQNGNTIFAIHPYLHQEQKDDDFMDINEESQDSQPPMLMASAVDPMVANGQSNGCCTSTSILVGTPPTSTTIIDEPPVGTETYGMVMITENVDKRTSRGHQKFEFIFILF